TLFRSRGVALGRALRLHRECPPGWLRRTLDRRAAARVGLNERPRTARVGPATMPGHARHESPMHENIIDALRRGAADEALTAAREAVAAQPQDPMAQRLLAAALRLAGDREGAVEAIDRAVALAPDDADVHLERAGLLLQERKLDEAQVALARSTGLDPNLFPAYVVQAQLALGRGE